MRRIALCPALLALASLLVAPAFGQAPPPPPGAIPPPPPPSDAGAPPPPPRGAAVILDRAQGGTIHVDVRCTDSETTRACVDIATQLFDRLNGASPAK